MSDTKKERDLRISLRIERCKFFLLILTLISAAISLSLTGNVRLFPYITGIGFFLIASLTFYQKERGYPGASYRSILIYLSVAVLNLVLSTRSV